MHDRDVFLEQALLAEDRITTDQLEEVRRYCREHRVDLVDGLVASELMTSRQIALVRADLCEVPFVELSDYEVCFANTRLLSRTLAERYCMFPLFMVGDVLTLAIDDPLNLEAMDQVRQLAPCEVDTVLCDRERLNALIARAYSLSHGYDEESGPQHVVDVSADADSSQPVVAAVNQMLVAAVEIGASDIHINPDEYELRLRYRVDGVLREQQGPPRSMHNGIVQRLKVMAQLDLTQTRRPQDGKFRFVNDATPFEVRLSTMPTVCGENVVMRLLQNTHSVEDFHQLGMPPTLAGELEELLTQPNGMVLVTGPTGSGKTTTLYAAINKLNDPARNIMTIEDPVEIRLPYIRQIQVHNEIGLTFSTALRSILRQDPDVVLVGEIRDQETCTIALQAALTGHLVLSTVHTNDAAGAVARLRDFGLPSFVINSAVLGAIAQRLVRRVCPHCVQAAEVSDLLRERFGLQEPVTGFVAGRGCGRCAQTGYSGRVGLFELLRFTSRIQSLVEQGAPVKRLREVAMAEGMRLMWQDGVEKARLGRTTLEEVAKAASVVALDPAPAGAPADPADARRAVA